MAFNSDNFALLSAPVNASVPAIFGYSSTADALATIVASGYFDSKSSLLKTGDAIHIIASDAKALRYITNTANVITVAAGS
jgi:hypothetical protein